MIHRLNIAYISEKSSNTGLRRDVYQNVAEQGLALQVNQ
jgi:hypothetical protein